MAHIKYIITAVWLILIGNSCAVSADTIDFPDRTDITLKNGLRVILIEHHEQPTISWKFMVKAGSVNNPPGKEGLAEITGELLKTGTSLLTYDAIVDTISLIGGSISISTRAEYTSVELNILKRHSDIGFDVFSDVILNPVFPSDEFNRIRKDYINYAKLELTNNHRIAYNHGNFLLFGDHHPLGRLKTKKTLKGLSCNDCRTYYQNFFYPNNCILLIIGDFSKENELKKINNKFGRWHKSASFERTKTEMDFLKHGSFRVVDKPKMTQAVIHLKQWGVDSRNKDYFAYQLMNYILGGEGFSSRLMDAVRNKGGKTYSIRSHYTGSLDYGVLSITTSTRNEELFNTYELMQSEFKKLIDKGITPEELYKAKAYKTGSLTLQLESPAMIARKVLQAIVKGFTIENLSKEAFHYKHVTVEDVNRVTRKYLKPEIMNTVIVGDEKKIREQLKKIGHYEKVHYKSPLVKEPLLFF